jgi:exodeoxyribonuclease VII large subunit
MTRGVKTRLNERTSRLEHIFCYIQNIVNDKYLWRNRSLLESLSRELAKNTQRKVESHKLSLARAVDGLDGASPLKILSKGFAYCRDEEKNKISSALQVTLGENIVVQFIDGDIKACVTDKVPVDRRLLD